jgi:hypothetical protein
VLFFLQISLLGDLRCPIHPLAPPYLSSKNESNLRQTVDELAYSAVVAMQTRSLGIHSRKPSIKVDLSSPPRIPSRAERSSFGVPNNHLLRLLVMTAPCAEVHSPDGLLIFERFLFHRSSSTPGCVAIFREYHRSR